jgi:hypothetical protein
VGTCVPQWCDVVVRRLACTWHVVAWQYLHSRGVVEWQGVAYRRVVTWQDLCTVVVMCCGEAAGWGDRAGLHAVLWDVAMWWDGGTCTSHASLMWWRVVVTWRCGDM